jgi:hypothetical protein
MNTLRNIALGILFTFMGCGCAMTMRDALEAARTIDEPLDMVDWVLEQAEQAEDEDDPECGTGTDCAE